MPSCELCGRQMKGRGRDITIDGVEMNVCPQCASKFGGSAQKKEKKQSSPSAGRRPAWSGRSSYTRSVPSKSSSSKQGSRPTAKSTRRSGGPHLDEMVLIKDYAEKIRSARQKKGLNQEELAQAIGERITTLQSIEAGKLKPTQKVIRGLERELEISLLESIGTVPLKKLRGKKAGGPTLGDVVKVKRKKSQKSD